MSGTRLPACGRCCRGGQRGRPGVMGGHLVQGFGLAREPVYINCLKTLWFRECEGESSPFRGRKLRCEDSKRAASCVSTGKEQSGLPTPSPTRTAHLLDTERWRFHRKGACLLPGSHTRVAPCGQLKARFRMSQLQKDNVVSACVFNGLHFSCNILTMQLIIRFFFFYKMYL